MLAEGGASAGFQRARSLPRNSPRPGSLSEATSAGTGQRISTFCRRGVPVAAKRSSGLNTESDTDAWKSDLGNHLVLLIVKQVTDFQGRGPRRRRATRTRLEMKRASPCRTVSMRRPGLGGWNRYTQPEARRARRGKSRPVPARPNQVIDPGKWGVERKRCRRIFRGKADHSRGCSGQKGIWDGASRCNGHHLLPKKQGRTRRPARITRGYCSRCFFSEYSDASRHPNMIESATQI